LWTSYGYQKTILFLSVLVPLLNPHFPMKPITRILHRNGRWVHLLILRNYHEEQQYSFPPNPYKENQRKTVPLRLPFFIWASVRKFQNQNMVG
jgi:hypothetical protein